VPGKDATSPNRGHTATPRSTQIPSGLRMSAGRYTPSALDTHQSENIFMLGNKVIMEV